MINLGSGGNTLESNEGLPWRVMGLPLRVMGEYPGE